MVERRNRLLINELKRVLITIEEIIDGLQDQTYELTDTLEENERLKEEISELKLQNEKWKRRFKRRLRRENIDDLTTNS